MIRSDFQILILPSFLFCWCHPIVKVLHYLMNLSVGGYRGRPYRDRSTKYSQQRSGGAALRTLLCARCSAREATPLRDAYHSEYGSRAPLRQPLNLNCADQQLRRFQGSLLKFSMCPNIAKAAGNVKNILRPIVNFLFRTQCTAKCND